ncbi:HEL299Wp [Eremothecium sinecaudum]|uniref:HEL299Wp n=1 Tax=Eremothecium sinecaudum TaxID=45286 RepID=A0A0X8HT48_9SACH|nr:HEL299Wp [Eremothecium sinecaudum]AMD20982.1 HEL299Wp [Eremothecium sinecaudum]
MSALDQFVMQDVAKHCPKQFMEMHKCIAQNRDDPSQCNFRQKDLATCIKQKVPSVQAIMSNCGDKMNDYQQCITDNMESRTINENCLGYLEEMRKCASKWVEGKTLPINEL